MGLTLLDRTSGAREKPFHHQVCPPKTQNGWGPSLSVKRPGPPNLPTPEKGGESDSGEDKMAATLLEKPNIRTEWRCFSEVNLGGRRLSGTERTRKSWGIRG
uniref:Uncharacterized protein n=1 Tax=Micrurus spixii TaxID=129469 RepID=A0A2D4MTZ6_9SAUR